MPPSRHRRRRGRAVPRGARSAAALAAARTRKPRVNKLYLLASLVIAVLVIGGFAVGGLSLGGGGGARTGKHSQYVAGLGEQQPVISSAHVPRGETVEYSSYPPASGDHWPPGNQAPCGFYPEGLRDERAVHNLEHGNIVVSYNLSSQAEVDQLRKVVDNIGLAAVWGVTRFYDRIPQGQVAVAAWGVLDTMQGIDRDRIKTFFEGYAGTLGPETVPC